MDRPRDVTTRLLLTCGAIGPPLFVVVALVEGATRPGYSAFRNYVSDLSLSEFGWMQIANFLVCGVLGVLFALGLRRTVRSAWGPALLAVFGLGLIAAGLFVTDPARGYPPGVPGGTQTAHGIVHGLSGLTVFSSLAAAAFVLSRRLAWRGWAAYSALTGWVVAVFFVASLAADPLHTSGVLPWEINGLLQRVAIVAGWGWIALLALRLSRSRPPSR
jgi:Protein of unknown function (DUF998)